MTDKILPQIEDWQNRPLDEVYPIVYIDAIHYSVRENGIIKKLAAYVILGINTEGKKEVLAINVGDNESSKYWLSVLNELKNRGVKDILVLCADGLSGIKEAIHTAFPKTEYQRCIVHMVRNTLKYVPDKDRKAFATDLNTIKIVDIDSLSLQGLDVPAFTLASDICSSKMARLLKDVETLCMDKVTSVSFKIKIKHGKFSLH